MSDEKITISIDEINHATPVPGTAVPRIFTSGYIPPEADRESPPRRAGLFVGIGVAVVALFCIACIGIVAIVGAPQAVSSNERTVSDYRAEIIREVESELATPDSKLRKRIEAAHLTVTVKSTRIVRCDVTTVNGSDRAGKDDSNIDKVSMLIRFNWEGVIDSGYTDLRLEYDVKNDRVLKSEIDHTTALVNAEDPSFWYGVCTIIGSML